MPLMHAKAAQATHAAASKTRSRVTFADPDEPLDFRIEKGSLYLRIGLTKMYLHRAGDCNKRASPPHNGPMGGAGMARADCA